MIPTSREILEIKYKLEGVRGILRIDQVTDFMIEFAKLHCKAQNEEIIRNINFKRISAKELDSQPYQPSIKDSEGVIWIFDKESIVNAYPLDLIK